MRLNRRFLVSVALGAAVGAAGVLGFTPVVRSMAVERAAGLGLEASVGGAWPGPDGVHLRGVSLSLPGVSGLRVWLDDVVVGWSSRRVLGVHGARIVAVGDAATLRGSLERWWGERQGRSIGADAAQVSGLLVEGVLVDWRREVGDGADGVQGAMDHVERAVDGSIALGGASVRARLHGVEVAVAGAALDVAREARGWSVRRIETESVEVTSARDVSGKEGPTAPDRGDASVEERARRARAALLSLSRELDERLATDAVVALRGVRVRWVVAGDELQVGPGTLEVRREPKAIAVLLAPSGAPSSGNEPFRLRLDVPRGDGAVTATQSIRAEVKGGPITLAQLGLKEGAFGLTAVHRSAVTSDVSVELTPDSQTLRVDGTGKVVKLAIKQPRLAADVVDGLELAWRGRFALALNGTMVRVDDGELDVGQLKFLGSGEMRRTAPSNPGDSPWRHLKVDLAFDVPLTNCQAAYESLPKGLIPKLQGMRFAGSLSAKGHARFDTDRVEKTFDVDWDGTLSCRVLEAPEGARVATLRKPFSKLVYTPEGEERTMTFGPGTDTWVPYAGIAKFMEVGAQVCEDGRFFRHHGFDKEAIINSFRDNLIAGAFRRGASTISMQLAKNLFLSRDKVLSRKLQEAILTTYLEQELTKQEILELYFNVIEFGPMVYGIGPAARHYFNTTPTALSLTQSLYLASILQNPKKQFFGEGGAVAPARLAYLQKLIKLAKKIHLVSDAEADAGLAETPVFGRPDAATPTNPEGTPAPTEASESETRSP